MPGESTLSYIFPILRYHDRWKELKAEDFKYFFKKEKVTYKGAMLHEGVKPVGKIPEGGPLADYALGEKPMEYLDKMRELCESKGIELILIKAPTLYPYWYPQWDDQITDYAQKHGLLYYNFIKDSEAAKINWQTDTYDAGLHLNRQGAEKLTKYFGQILTEKTSLP
jgi:hypothetical protein